MKSFEDLGISPELAEILAAEGIEVPTDFQETAIPLLLRGNDLLVRAGPGAGILVAYGAALLHAADPDASSPQGLALVPGPERALRLAESLSRLALASGHRVAALGSPWALPQLASILFATPTDVMEAVRRSSISVEGVRCVVVDGFGALSSADVEVMETLFEVLPKEAQRVLFGQPLTAAAEEFGKAHFHRAVHIPPRAAQGGGEEAPPHRGRVAYRVVGEEKLSDTLRTVAEALEGEARHVVLHAQTEDQAADLGDFLALHGFMAGPPGENDAPVWLAVNELETRRVLDALDQPSSVTVVSHDVPAGPDSLDRRHGGDEEGMILVRSRELNHLKDVARRTGYDLVPAREPVPTRVAGEMERLRTMVERALEEEDLAPHYLALEPLYGKYAPGEVAAAALALLRNQSPVGTAERSQDTGAEAESPGAGTAGKAWIRLFVGVGAKEGIGPGDLLGAIAGEAGVEGSQVGKIEIRETFSLVEVKPPVAEKIIKALNGTTIRGRSVRVDYDRGGPRGAGGKGGRDSRPGKPRRGGARKN